MKDGGAKGDWWCCETGNDRLLATCCCSLSAMWVCLRELKGWGQDVLRDGKYAGAIAFAINTNVGIFSMITFELIRHYVNDKMG
jgi:hypothetical protein